MPLPRNRAIHLQEERGYETGKRMWEIWLLCEPNELRPEGINDQGQTVADTELVENRAQMSYAASSSLTR
jgi:hypothetical protein